MNINNHGSRKISLPELIAIQMRKEDVASLQNLDRWEKRYLAGVLENVDTERPSLDEWNFLLMCVSGSRPKETKRAAKSHLIYELKRA